MLPGIPDEPVVEPLLCAIAYHCDHVVSLERITLRTSSKYSVPVVTKVGGGQGGANSPSLQHQPLHFPLRRQQTSPPILLFTSGIDNLRQGDSGLQWLQVFVTMSTVASLSRYRIGPLRYQRYPRLLQPESIALVGSPLASLQISAVISAVHDLLLRISCPMSESLGMTDLHQGQGGIENTGATPLVLDRTNQVLADGAVEVRQAGTVFSQLLGLLLSVE